MGGGGEGGGGGSKFGISTPRFSEEGRKWLQTTMDSEYSQDYSSSRITKVLTSILKRNYTQTVFSS